MASRWGPRLLEFVLWVGAASAAVIVASLALGLLVGRDLVTGKYVLFVVGVLLFGLASLMLQPSRPRSERDLGGERPDHLVPDVEGDRTGLRDRAPDVDTVRERLGLPATHQHRFEARLQEVGPLAEADLPFGDRIGRAYKLFATSLVVLAFSLGMELVGIHV